MKTLGQQKFSSDMEAQRKELPSFLEGRDTKKSVKKMAIMTIIEKAATVDNKLIIAGWCLPLDPASIDGFSVFIDKSPLKVQECELYMSSPEAAKEIPQIPHASNCRFRLTAEITGQMIQSLTERLITVTPIYGLHRGDPSVCMVMPESFSPPDEDSVKFVGGNFYIVGLEFTGLLLRLASLKPDSSVLDIGCGVGRIAYPLSRYLSSSGIYQGFDIWDAGIAWAKKHISADRPNFSFLKVDLYNKFYNLGGKIKSSEFIFPYDEGTFDVSFLTSVFTHMYALDVRHYLSEIFRVLKGGGRCLLTCWLLNSETLALTAAGKSRIDFAYKLDDCYTADKEVPENVMGFEEDKMVQWITSAGFSINKICYGYWCGRERFTSYQDILIIEKP